MKSYIVLDIETTGLNAIDNRITCICAKYVGEKCNIIYKDCFEDESELIKGFVEFLSLVLDSNRSKQLKFVTKNGKQFDIPMIVCRNSFLGSPVNIKWEDFIKDFKQVDIQEATKKRINMDDMAFLMGFPQKSSNGLQAIKWFEQGEYEKVKKYCWDDVLITEKIFLKLEENKVEKNEC